MLNGANDPIKLFSQKYDYKDGLNMPKKISGIYCIENTINNKKYIGQSVDIKERWRKHRKELYANKHDNDYLQKSWNKYGKDSFKFCIIEECDSNILDEREIFYINHYNTLDRDYGYNLKSGGQNGGSKVSDEVKSKMSQAIKNSYTDSLKDKRRTDALNYWANPENKKRALGDNNGMYGMHHTDETKRKMSLNRSGIPSWRRNTTPVLCVELNKAFIDATDAGKQLNLDSGGILKVCQGKRKTCGGYHWSFNNLGK